MSEKNKEFSFDPDQWEEELDKEFKMTDQDKHLAEVTGFVSKNYGPKAALIFYIDFIQPIKQRLEELKNGEEDSSRRTNLLR